MSVDDKGKGPSTEDVRGSGPGQVVVSSKTLLWAILLGGCVAIVLLSVGVAVALFGLQEVRDDLEALRQTVSSAPRGGRAAPPSLPPLPSEPLSLNGAQTRGSSSARVGIVEFSDFQCPFCSRFAKTTHVELAREYVDTGRVLLAFRHLPLDQIHPDARKAAEAAECAGRQDKFWQMHDRLFVDPTRLSSADLHAHAQEVGLRMDLFRTCIAGEASQRVTQDVAEAERLQVFATPGFLVGTIESDGRLKVVERLSGAQPISAFRAVLDRLLSTP